MSSPQASRPSAVVYRRRRLVAGALALLVLGLGVGGVSNLVSALTRPLAPAVVTSALPSVVSGPAASIALPATGRMALAADGFDGLLAQSGAQTAAPIASISKVVTALVVLSVKPIAAGSDGPSITFTDADVRIRAAVIAENGSNAPVTSGLTLSERQALTVMLLHSANNYAISLANWAFGSTEAFMTAAKLWLEAHGLTDTVLTEPTGFSASNVSTPADLVRIGQLAEADPVLADIVDDPEATVPGVGTVTNTNTLLGQASITGLKTGTTPEAGSCLLFSAKFQVADREITLVGVVLGGSSHDRVDRDVRALVSSAIAAFQPVTIANAGDEVGTATTAWGQSSVLRAATALQVITFSDRPVSVSTALDTVRFGAAGARVGSVRAVSGNTSVDANVVLATALDAPNAWWRLTHVDALG
ncbi:MAG: D-alanyl-D-alanine carboxypeptidase family protein [Agromyces sp.]